MILGVMIFYDDGPELLERSLKSLKLVSDKILAIDGAYKEFPHKDFLSSQECLKIVNAYADQVIIPEKEWDDEPAKRNAYLTLKSKKDYYIMLDADEEIVGSKPKNLKFPTYRIALETIQETMTLPGFYNRLFRHHSGMKYHLTHNNLITPDGTSLTIPENHIPICESFKIIHRPGDRPKSRQLQDGVFEKNKAERNVVLPTVQKTPAENVAATPFKVKYLGKAISRGFDIINGQTTPIICNQNDFILMSQNKWNQVNKDFPGTFILIKDLTNG